MNKVIIVSDFWLLWFGSIQYNSDLIRVQFESFSIRIYIYIFRLLYNSLRIPIGEFRFDSVPFGYFVHSDVKYIFIQKITNAS